MVNVQTVLGIDNLSIDSTDKIICSYSDDFNIFVGTSSPKNGGNLWRYSDLKGWENITTTLSDYEISSVDSILKLNKTIYVSTSKGTNKNYGAQVFKNSGNGWADTSVSSISNLTKIRNLKLSYKTETDIEGNIIKIINPYVFALGTNADVCVYDGISWTKFLDTSVFSQYLANWADATSDSFNVIGSILNSSYSHPTSIPPIYAEEVQLLGIDISFPFSNLIYKIPSVNFDANNKFISKVLTYKEKIYITTLNDVSGCEVWRLSPGQENYSLLEGEDVTWEQINTDGFGSKYNWNITSIKGFGDYILVTTENPRGPELWAFDINSETWSKIAITSKSFYSNYLIEIFQNKVYLIGKQIQKLICNQDPQVYLTPYDRGEKNTNYWPFGSFGSIKTSASKYKFAGANGAYSIMSEGTLLDPLKNASMSPQVSGYNITDKLPNAENIQINLGSSSLNLSSQLPGAWTSRYNFDKNETNFSAAFPGFTYVNAAVNQGETPRYYVYPDYLNALHMSLIPKGKHRGKIIAWNANSLIGYAPTIDPVNPWSFQAWSIIDPSEDAGTEEKPRFLNYMLPIGPSALFSYDEAIGDTRFDIFWPNLFCAGHTWDPDGNLVVAGGSRFGFKYDVNGRVIGDGRTYIWNPEPSITSGSFTSSIPVNNNGQIPQTPFYYNQEHYASAGSWVRGPNLDQKRWYPTVNIYPSVSSTNDDHHVLVLGGVSLLFYEPFPYYTYESFIIKDNPTVSASNLFRDFGRSPYSSYIVNYLGPGTTTSPPNVALDSFVFYPRTFLMKNGSMTFAGFAPLSSRLVSHESNPGYWETDLGHEYLENSWSSMRVYGTAVRLPNNNQLSAVDVFLRIGGGDDTINPTLSPETEIDTQTVDKLDASINSNQWDYGPDLTYDRMMVNSVILPDATIFVNGGIDFRAGFQLNASFAEETWTSSLSPIKILDHHGHGGVTFTDSDHSEAEHHLHSLEHILEVYDIVPPETAIDPNDPTNDDATNPPINNIKYHRIPEVLNSTHDEWTPYWWAPATSWRDYHSASLLLPDGRVFVGGGEGRHSLARTDLVNGIGYDFEVFSPKYLRPTQVSSDYYPKPESVIVSGATFNYAPSCDAYEITYGGSYVVSSSFIRSDVTLEKVVLMAPGSVTHHSCYNQRYYQCSSTILGTNKILITLPSEDTVLLPGFYMLFALTTQDVPANAIWVKLIY